MPETISFRRRKLPHWRVANRSYFVTFRLHSTIPKNVIRELKEKREKLSERSSDDEVLEYQRFEFARIEKILDAGNFLSSYITDRAVAPMILDCFMQAENESGWRFPSIVLMPNHVHCLCCGEKATLSLDGFLKKLKGLTAFKANALLGRRGIPFWASESFDHWCRNSEKEESVKRYIRNNPVKAGLVKKPEDWPWLVEKSKPLSG